MACEEGRAQTFLALVELLNEITRLELAPAGFECRPGDADKRRGPEWIGRSFLASIVGHFYDFLGRWWRG
jgi:hypothetical protein